jgi:hypothetical protein
LFYQVIKSPSKAWFAAMTHDGGDGRVQNGTIEACAMGMSKAIIIGMFDRSLATCSHDGQIGAKFRHIAVKGGAPLRGVRQGTTVGGGRMGSGYGALGRRDVQGECQPMGQ